MSERLRRSRSNSTNRRRKRRSSVQGRRHTLDSDRFRRVRFLTQHIIRVNSYHRVYYRNRVMIMKVRRVEERIVASIETCVSRARRRRKSWMIIFPRRVRFHREHENVDKCRILSQRPCNEGKPYFYFKICEEREDEGMI